MKLKAHVPVTDDMLRVHVFGPDDEVPEWAAVKITNPDAWETPQTVETTNGVALTLGTRQQALEVNLPSAITSDDPILPAPAPSEVGAAAVEVKTEVAHTTQAAIEIPPRGGPKATVDAWRDYATAATARAGLNIEIPADAGRNEIIEALTDAGVATE